jgi:hypothetical protein
LVRKCKARIAVLDRRTRQEERAERYGDQGGKQEQLERAVPGIAGDEVASAPHQPAGKAACCSATHAVFLPSR